MVALRPANINRVMDGFFVFYFMNSFYLSAIWVGYVLEGSSYTDIRNLSPLPFFPPVKWNTELAIFLV